MIIANISLSMIRMMIESLDEYFSATVFEQSIFYMVLHFT